MTRLDPQDSALLDHLCGLHHRGARVVNVRVACRPALKRLRYAGLVGFEDFTPSGSAMRAWKAKTETCAEKQTEQKCLSETPAPAAAEPPLPAEPGSEMQGGDAAARRAEASPPKRNRGYQRKTEAPFGDRRYAINRDTRGASGTARKASSASESTDAKSGIEATASPPDKRIEDRAPSIPPLPSAAELHAEILAFTKRSGISNQRFGLMVSGSPSWVPNLQRRKYVKAEEVDRARQLIRRHDARQRAAPVDIKVNIGTRSTIHETCSVGLAEREHLKSARDRQTAAKRVRTEAMRCIEAGKPGRNHSIRSMMEEIQRQEADQARIGDNVEQAKLVIRKRGYACFDAEVSLGKHGRGKFYVGRNLVTKDELLAYAKRLGEAG